MPPVGLAEHVIDADSFADDDPYWSAEELASFSMHPGNGRVLNIRPGPSDTTPVEGYLKDAGYCLGRLPITRDPSNLPLAAATFGPALIYLTLEEPSALCLAALESLACDEKTRDIPLVALIPEYAPASIIDEAYSRAGCDFFRLGATQIELLARTHLLIRLRSALPGNIDNMTTLERPIPEAANAPVGSRLDLRDPATQAYTPTYLRHRLPTEAARAHRYGRPLTLVAVRCPDAAYSDETACKLARRLEENSRDVDLVARYELDLFVLLLPETDTVGAQVVQERLHAAFIEDKVNARIGCAHLGDANSESVHTGAALLQRACALADDP